VTDVLVVLLHYCRALIVYYVLACNIWIFQSPVVARVFLPDFVCLFVYLSVCKITQKVMDRFF